jgi:cholesterol transport system auxiliary component
MAAGLAADIARRSARFGMLPIVAALAAGCSVLQGARVEDPVLHVLDARPAVVATPATRDIVLEVSAPRAAPGYDSPAIAYVQRPFVLDYFAIHRWADTPARMVGPLLVRAAEQTGYFRAVVQAPTAATADFRLDSELSRLQQDFTTRPSRVELSLRLQLVEIRTRRVVATRVIEVTSAAATDDPGGGVAAANAAMAQALAQAAEFCVAATVNHAPPGARER